MFIICSKRI